MGREQRGCGRWAGRRRGFLGTLPVADSPQEHGEDRERGREGPGGRRRTAGVGLGGGDAEDRSGPGRSRRRDPAEPRLRPREPGERATSRHQPNGRLHEPEREQRDADAARAAPMSRSRRRSARPARSARGRAAGGRRAAPAGRPRAARTRSGARRAPARPRPVPRSRPAAAGRSEHASASPLRAPGPSCAGALRALALAANPDERPDDHVGARRGRAAGFDHDAELAALGAQLTAGSDPHAAGDDLPRGAPMQRCGQRALVDGQVDDPPGGTLPPQAAPGPTRRRCRSPRRRPTSASLRAGPSPRRPRPARPRGSAPRRGGRAADRAAG